MPTEKKQALQRLEHKEGSLFDPLERVSPLLRRPKKKVIAKESPYTPDEQNRILSDLEPEKGHPSPESDKK